MYGTPKFAAEVQSTFSQTSWAHPVQESGFKSLWTILGIRLRRPVVYKFCPVQKKLSLYLRGKRPGRKKCRTLFHVCLHLTCLVSLCHVSNGCANTQWPKTFALQVGLLPVEARPSQACTSECHDLEPACTYNICTMLRSVQGRIMKNLSKPFRNHDHATQQAVSVCAEVLSYHTSYHSSSPALSTAPPRGNFEEFRLARPHPWNHWTAPFASTSPAS